MRYSIELLCTTVLTATVALPLCCEMKAHKFLKYFILVVVAGNLAIVAMVLISGLSPKAVPLPNPNGYDNFVKAGRMLVETTKVYNYESLGKEELAALVAKNEAALELVRTGLNQQCRVPDDYSPAYLSRRMPDILSMKQLVVILCAQGRLAELESHTNEAAKLYLSGIHFGQESSRGGVIVSRLVGIACERIALSRLESLTNRLGEPECREVIQAVEILDAKAEPAQETMQQEHAWSRKTTDLRGKIYALWQRKTLQKQESDFIKKQQGNALHRRQAMVAFAVRAYALEKGQPPQTLADLVPAYLKAIPQDPFTGTNLVYQP
ncbi:MAG: hypothetical protein JWR69_3734 [Pedosphaera sp.]|nr:hypothetical protein [Pedosphaera sp.]